MKLLLALLLLSLVKCNAYNILAVLPLPILSHQLYFRPILRELSNRGHDVTVITMRPEDNANYKQIIVNRTEFDETKGNIDFISMRKFYWFVFASKLSKVGEISACSTFQSPEVQQIIHSSDLHFDLIIVESTFVQEAHITFGHKFGAPVVELHSLCTSFWANELMSNPYMLSYTADFRTSLSNYMSFLERLYNTILGLSSIVISRYIFLPKQQALVDQYMNYTGWETRPTLIEQLSNISLAVELQNFFDDAKEGVIYFSLGSNLNSSTMPEETQQAFLAAFAKMPQTILWKWERESMPNQSNNVKLAKWCPQTDILAHLNTKAFISHGGILSITESVYHGVPLVLIPLFLDQFKNTKQAETAGFGVTLNFDNITEESISWSVKEIVKPSYQAAVKKQSVLLRDNQIPPLDSAMYWIEYVIRHKGAPHLRTAAVHLSLYQYFLIDVIAFLAVTVVALFILITFLLKTIIRYVCVIKSKMKNNGFTKKRN